MIWRRVKTIAVIGLCLLALSAALLSLAAAVGLAAPLAAALAPVMFVVAPFMVVILVGRRRALVTLTCVAAWLIAAFVVSSDVLAVGTDAFAAKAAVIGPRVRLLTLNVSDHNADPARVVRYLESTQPDIIMLQEAREGFLRRLETRLHDYPTRITCARVRYCGVAIFARYPGVAGPGGVAVAWPAPGPLMSDDLRVASATLMVMDGTKRVEVPVIAVHLYRAGLGAAAPGQLPALEASLKNIAPSDTMLLAGDFNSIPNGHAMRGFDADTPLRRLTRLLPTWPANFPLFSIDHLYAGARWSLVDIERFDVGSDHTGLLAQLELH